MKIEGKSQLIEAIYTNISPSTASCYIIYIYIYYIELPDFRWEWRIEWILSTIQQKVLVIGTSCSISESSLNNHAIWAVRHTCVNCNFFSFPLLNSRYYVNMPFHSHSLFFSTDCLKMQITHRGRPSLVLHEHVFIVLLLLHIYTHRLEYFIYVFKPLSLLNFLLIHALVAERRRTPKICQVP